MVSNHTNLEQRLWTAADELRANSKLRASDYSLPVLGLIFLKYADFKFERRTAQLQAAYDALPAGDRSRRRAPLAPERYQRAGVLYLPPESRYTHLVALPEGEAIGRAINDAMKGIEAHNDALKGVLPKTYVRFESATLRTLLRTFNGIPMDIEGDVFGKIYEYFLGKFAMAEGQKGGEFFTPTSIVKLIVEIIEPFKGLILDPAAGSGGMFVQSARFMEEHRRSATDVISIYGQERVADNVRLCKMNLAVHGLEGQIREGNSYYDNPFRAVGRFDFVMANPPFNVNRVDKERIKNDRQRYPLGIPTVDNANYLWIQLFYSALNERGRAGFVMANSASDARGSELELRKRLIQAGHVDVMVAVGSNFFYTVTLPCTLWFLNKRQGAETQGRKDEVLFLDARRIYTQVDRAHREFSPAQLEFLANIVRLYRGEAVETGDGSADLLAEHGFLDLTPGPSPARRGEYHYC
ncbi:MAG: class I SAM-dependent DNA methyltransferase, partial [Chloroflexota bacterium]|nr:class I SAM-dependent DNA methyltransferase [Chloroflexota bacterium]